MDKATERFLNKLYSVVVQYPLAPVQDIEVRGKRQIDEEKKKEYNNED